MSPFNYVKLDIDKLVDRKLVSRVLDGATRHSKDTNRKKEKWIRYPISASSPPAYLVH